MFRWMILGIALVLAGCGGAPEIDATSASNFEHSVEQVKQSLPPEDRELFERSVEALMMEGMNPLTLGLEIMADPGGGLPEAVVEKFNGKTAQQVIEAAAPALEAKQKKERKRYEELLAGRAANARVQSLLESVQLTGMELDVPDSAYSNAVRIRGTARNGTDLPIHRLTAQVRVLSPERSSPWLEMEGFQTIAGGIEPGESRDIELYASRMDGWRPDVELPENIQIEAKAIRFTTPDDQRIAPKEGGLMDDYDFEQLHEKYGED